MYQEQIIYKLTGVWPEVRKPIRNPLRSDKKPGCWFDWKSGYLRLNDYSHPEFQGMNMYGIVMYQQKCDFLGAKKIIENLCGGEIPEPVECTREFKFDLKWKPRAFTNKDIGWWAKYGINENQLITDAVYSVDWYKYNSEDNPKLYTYREPDMGFALTFGNRKKIYRPIPPHKSLKWKADVTKEDVWFDLRRDEGDELFVFGSYKDARVVKNLGYNVRGLQSESSIPHDTTLKRWAEQFKTIWILFDLDDGGDTNVERFYCYAKDYGNYRVARLPEGIRKYGLKDIAEVRYMWDDRITNAAIKKSKQ